MLYGVCSAMTERRAHARAFAMGACFLVGLASAGVAQDRAANYASVRADRVAAPALKGPLAAQYLAADDKGNPQVLRGDTFEVFSLGVDATFDHRLGRLACDPSSGPAYAAAMDPWGKSWALGWAMEVAICDFARQERPPALQWVISSLAYSALGPLVGVTSAGPVPDVGTRRKAVPRVFALKDHQWQPVAWAPITHFKEKPASPLEGMAAAKAMSDASYCSGPNDALWMASWNSYHLAKLSTSEVPEHEVVVGSGEVELRKLDSQAQEQEQRESDAQGANRLPVPVSAEGVPRGVVRALVCARDGDVYLVVSTPAGLALDRYNPSQRTLDRVLLVGAHMSSSGPMTAALTGDTLWLAGRLTTDGIWRIPLEELVNAPWKPVKDAREDGKPLS
jgi:hypothetical protein